MTHRCTSSRLKTVFCIFSLMRYQKPHRYRFCNQMFLWYGKSLVLILYKITLTFFLQRISKLKIIWELKCLHHTDPFAKWQNQFKGTGSHEKKTKNRQKKKYYKPSRHKKTKVKLLAALSSIEGHAVCVYVYMLSKRFFKSWIKRFLSSQEVSPYGSK